MSSSLSHVTTITAAVLDTILEHMAPLFLASTGGDLFAARHAAGCALAAYDAETEEEVRLSAEIVSFSLHALEALGQAMAPDLPLNKVLRLRGGAVNLNRAAHRSQRKLDQVLRERRAASNATALSPCPDDPAQAATTVPIEPPAEPVIPPLGPVGRMREAPEPAGWNGVQPWTLAHQQRLAAARITETFKRKHAEHISREASRAAPSAPAAALAGIAGVQSGADRLQQSAAP